MRSFLDKKALLAGAVALLLAACGSPGGNPTLELSGTLGMGFSGGSGLADPLILQTPWQPPKTASEVFVPGEVLVKFKPGLSVQSVQTLSVGGVSLQHTQSLPLRSATLYRASVSAAQTLELVRQLRSRSDVEWAYPNYIWQAFATPNDPAYVDQWHYPAINLPQAWDIEKGTTNPVTVAVVDTGILSQHPDFAGTLLPGYDFISNPQVAGDGDGRDNNPEDVGDEPGGQSSYHGSHVGGTIAAATNNARGVAGVSWGAKALHVRVLGAGGGSMADILLGTAWAAGLAVEGVPNNPNPAQVINMSLGGRGTCVQPVQEIFNAVFAKGAIVVVAAGNDNQNAAEYTPASCSGVITVGATDFQGHRAPYSNYGPRIDLMAPGGDLRADLNADGYPDGVLSPLKRDQNGEFVYAFYQGTSMAAPHVAGVIALMKSRRPNLTGLEALSILKQTARRLTPTACTGKGPAQTANDCGAGLIDADAALRALGGGTNPPPPLPGGDFDPSLVPNSLTLKPGSSTTVTVNFARTNFSDTINLSLSGAPSGVVGTFSQASVTGSNATLNLNVSGSAQVGNYGLTITATGGGKSKTVTLSLRIESASVGRPTLNGTVVVACYYIGNDCDQLRSQALVINSNITSTRYSFKNLEAGRYLIIAWKDSNNNDELDSGDWLGVYTENGNLVLVQPPRSDLSFNVDLVQDLGAAKVGLESAVLRFVEASRR
jgi:serine protease|uniref:Peptidase S8 n=1 Tax=Meiothermus ruber TaxID=277 RepID=A0A7C3HIJ0_MEIRU